MSFLETRQRVAQAERRRSARFTVEIPAVFRTVGQDRICQMANISDHGAKLLTKTPPPSGINGWLILGKQEIYCRVVWASKSECGIEFERTIGEAALDDIAGEAAQANGPVARCGNIPMGRKRGRLVIG